MLVCVCVCVLWVSIVCKGVVYGQSHRMRVREI